MGIAQDLLAQANHLATYQALGPTQCDLRRAVSTAYYALFHLLVEDTGQRWQGGTKASEAGLQRALDHGPMRQVSMQFSTPNWTDWRGSVNVVPLQLRRVAGTFADLQEDRHIADYNNQEPWTNTEVQEILIGVALAFQDWHSIRTDPMAGNYLLAMLIGKRRQ